MNNINQPAFAPAVAEGCTVNLTAGTSTGNVKIQTGNNSRHVRVYNSGSVTAFLAFGNSSSLVATTTTGMPVAGGTVEIFACSHQYVAAITASSTAAVYLTPGEGL